MDYGHLDEQQMMFVLSFSKTHEGRQCAMCCVVPRHVSFKLSPEGSALRCLSSAQQSIFCFGRAKWSHKDLSKKSKDRLRDRAL